jgi:hypothetical protein
MVVGSCFCEVDVAYAENSRLCNVRNLVRFLMCDVNHSHAKDCH